MININAEFELHLDRAWERLYNSDQELIQKEKFKHYLKFSNKIYVIFKKHVSLSDYLCDHIPQDTNESTISLNSTYCKDPVAFDYFMQILYGKNTCKQC